MEDRFPQVAWEGTQALRSADSNLNLRVVLGPEGLSVETSRGPGHRVSICKDGGRRAEPFPIPQCSLPEPYLSIFSQMSAILNPCAVKCPVLWVSPLPAPGLGTRPSPASYFSSSPVGSSTLLCSLPSSVPGCLRDFAQGRSLLDVYSANSLSSPSYNHSSGGPSQGLLNTTPS